MPIDFLTTAQKERYGRFHGDPSAAQLSKFFYLDDADLRAIADRHGESKQLGFALQLCAVRFLGTFLVELSEIPPSVVHFVAQQLGIDDPVPMLIQYKAGRTQREHQVVIAGLYGYREYNNPLVRIRLVRNLYTKVWLSCDRPVMLFDEATAWLVSQKVLLPGVTVLERLIVDVRNRAHTRLWSQIASRVDAPTRTRLLSLLRCENGSHFTELERLRRPPSRLTVEEFLRSLDRVRRISNLTDFGPLFRRLDLSSLPPVRLRALYRHVNSTPVQSIERIGERDQNRCIAMLAAWTQLAEMRAHDDTLDLFDQLIAKLLNKAVRVGKQERLRTIKELDKAALLLSEACSVLFNSSVEDVEVRTAAFALVPKPKLIKALYAVGELTRPPDDEYLEYLKGSYSRVRRFLPQMLSTLRFESTETGRSVLDALTYLYSLEGSKKQTLTGAPLKAVPRQWTHLVMMPGNVVNRRYYTLCIMERLRTAL